MASRNGDVNLHRNGVRHVLCLGRTAKRSKGEKARKRNFSKRVVEFNRKNSIILYPIFFDLLINTQESVVSTPRMRMPI